MCDNKMRQDINNYVDMEHKTERNNVCMKIAYLAINKGRLKDLDTLKTLGGQANSHQVMHFMGTCILQQQV